MPHNGTLERERVGRWLRLCGHACLNESVTQKIAKNPQTPPQHAGHTISSGSTRSPLPLWQYSAQLLATMFLVHINTILVHWATALSITVFTPEYRRNMTTRWHTRITVFTPEYRRNMTTHWHTGMQPPSWHPVKYHRPYSAIIYHRVCHHCRKWPTDALWITWTSLECALQH